MEKFFKPYLISILLALGHGLNDLLAGYLLIYFYQNQSYEIANSLFFAYIILGFGCQSFAGLLIDYFPQPKFLIILCCFLWFFAAFYKQMNVVILVFFIGIASAFVHVVGGNITLSLAKQKAKHVGIFISPGALGLALGAYFAYLKIDLFLFVLLFSSFLMVAFAYLDFSKTSTLKVENQPFDGKSNKIAKFKKIEIWGIILGLMLVLSIRSFIWEIGQYVHQGNYNSIIIIGSFAFIGKLMGGFLSDKINHGLFLVVTLFISFICLIFDFGNIWVEGIGFSFLQASLPLSILQISALFEKRIGFSIGLALGFAILLGGIPFLFTNYDINNLSLIVAVFSGLIIIILALLKPLLNQVEKDK